MSIWVFLNFTFRRVQKNERKKIKKMTVCKAFYRFAFFFGLLAFAFFFWSVFGVPIRLFFLDDPEYAYT